MSTREAIDDASAHLTVAINVLLQQARLETDCDVGLPMLRALQALSTARVELSFANLNVVVKEVRADQAA